eukprot:jgi/Mesvir1/14469/Mv05178-RA.1
MEVKLYTDRAEREKYESLADLFAIIKTTEKLERAYVRDAITPQQYEPACYDLIAKAACACPHVLFVPTHQQQPAQGVMQAVIDTRPTVQKANFKTLKQTLNYTTDDVQHFMSEYNMRCPAAANRLLVSTVPATLEHARPRPADATALNVAEAVQHFITAMDNLRLNMVAVDQVYPLLNDLLQSLYKVPQLPPNFEGREKVKGWIATLSNMRASDELTESQVREMLFNLDNAYNAFMSALNLPTAAH